MDAFIAVGLNLSLMSLCVFFGFQLAQAKLKNSDIEYNLTVIKEELFNLSAKLEK